jgi:hypothetical protein
MRVRFADVAKIAVTRELDVAPHGTVYAALPGAEFRWCAVLEDASGRPLRFRRESLALTARGPVSPVGTSDCFRFTVLGPGEVATTLRYGGFTRTDRVRVVGAEEIVAIDVADLEGISPSAPIAVDEDVLGGVPPATELDVTGCEDRSNPKRVLARGRLRDGGVALLSGSAFRVVPDELATLGAPSADARQPVRKIHARTRGRGTLDTSSGAIAASVALVVRGACLDPLPDAAHDAGTGGDASIEGEAGLDIESDAGADASTD